MRNVVYLENIQSGLPFTEEMEAFALKEMAYLLQVLIGTCSCGDILGINVVETNTRLG